MKKQLLMSLIGLTLVSVTPALAQRPERPPRPETRVERDVSKGDENPARRENAGGGVSFQRLLDRFDANDDGCLDRVELKQLAEAARQRLATRAEGRSQTRQRGARGADDGQKTRVQRAQTRRPEARERATRTRGRQDSGRRAQTDRVPPTDQRRRSATRQRGQRASTPRRTEASRRQGQRRGSASQPRGRSLRRAEALRNQGPRRQQLPSRELIRKRLEQVKKARAGAAQRQRSARAPQRSPGRL